MASKDAEIEELVTELEKRQQEISNLSAEFQLVNHRMQFLIPLRYC